MAAEQTSKGPSSAKIPFKLRLKAWWDGNDLYVKPPAAPGGDKEVVPSPALSWTEARIGLSQKIWGEGFSSPGEEDYILGLVKSLGLTPAMSVLDLGAGLGGAGRVMAQNFGCWVTSLEANADLAKAGNDISVKMGLTKKAPVEPFDPETVELKENAYDCVFSQGALFTMPGKERLLQQIDGSLKEKGQLLLTDFVKTETAVEGGALSKWIAQEPLEPQVWSAEDYTSYIEALGYDVRVVEDISDRFKTMVTKGWAAFLSSIDKAGLDHETGAALVTEVELWTHRTKTLESGELRISRLHALKTGSLISVSAV